MITIGRLVARKATVQLIDNFAASNLANAHLVIVGDGPDVPAVEQRATELGVRNRVHMLGQVSDAEKYAALSVADAFVTASQHEGFGLVFLEAMAFGLPVLCYDRGGQTDFLVTGETGHVVKLNDRQAFVRALSELHENHEARERQGRHNRQLVENYFIDTCAARYEAIFERAIDGSRRTAGKKKRPVSSTLNAASNRPPTAQR
jgi:glycosyltransferase involved in cell wall biosynthesis